MPRPIWDPSEWVGGVLVVTAPLGGQRRFEVLSYRSAGITSSHHGQYQFLCRNGEGEVFEELSSNLKKYIREGYLRVELVRVPCLL